MLCLVENQVMILKLLIFALCFLALMGPIAAFGSMGPLGNIIVDSIYECEEPPVGDEINVTVRLRILECDECGEMDQAIDVVLENKIPIDDDLNLEVNIKKFENGAWKPFWRTKGKACNQTNYMPKLWSKIVSAFEPKLNNTCPIPPGSYKFEKLQIDTDDVGVKKIFYGKLLVKVTLTDQSGKLVYCRMGEGSSQAPS